MTSKNLRTIRADIPSEVWDRLATEAALKGVPLGRHLRNLIVSRDKRLQDKPSATDSTGPSNRK